MVGTWSRPYGLCHRPYTLAHIKGFGSSLLECPCLLTFMLYAYVSLSCSRLCHIWHLQRVCSCVFTFDAHEALSRCNHLECICTMLVASCIPFPFSVLCDDMLTMLVCATRWLSVHLYKLAYMSMHESCLLVCCPCFNTMKLWTSNPNLHLSPTNTTFCLLFRLSCLLSCYTCHVYHAYLLYSSFIHSLLLFLLLLVC